MMHNTWHCLLTRELQIHLILTYEYPHLLLTMSYTSSCVKHLEQHNESNMNGMPPSKTQILGIEESQLVHISRYCLAHHRDRNCLNSIKHATVTKWLEDVRYLFPPSGASTIAKVEKWKNAFDPRPRESVRIFAHPWPNYIYKIFFLFSAKHSPNIANTYIDRERKFVWLKRDFEPQYIYVPCEIFIPLDCAFSNVNITQTKHLW